MRSASPTPPRQATGSGTAPATFHQRTGASFYNHAAGSSALASVTYSYPSAGVTEITDAAGELWRVTSGSTGHSVRRPGASSDTLGASLSGGIVTSATNGGVTTTYSRSVSGTTATMTVTNALSQVSTIVSSLTTGRPTSVTDPLSRTTAYQYDSSGRPTRVTAPEGNYLAYTYDSRGNVIQTEAVPKAGSGLPSIVTSASFDSTCSNPLDLQPAQLDYRRARQRHRLHLQRHPWRRADGDRARARRRAPLARRRATATR